MVTDYGGRWDRRARAAPGGCRRQSPGQEGSGFFPALAASPGRLVLLASGSAVTGHRWLRWLRWPWELRRATFPGPLRGPREAPLPSARPDPLAVRTPSYVPALYSAAGPAPSRTVTSVCLGEARGSGHRRRGRGRVQMSSSLLSAVTKMRAWKPARKKGEPSLGCLVLGHVARDPPSQAERSEGCCPRHADSPGTGVGGFTGVSGDAAGVWRVCVSSLALRSARVGSHRLLPPVWGGPVPTSPTGVRGAGPHVPGKCMTRLGERVGL